jgi:hypothetical protein
VIILAHRQFQPALRVGVAGQLFFVLGELLGDALVQIVGGDLQFSPRAS